MKSSENASAAGSFSVQQFLSEMLESGDVRHKFYISYGAMNHVFDFFDAQQIISFQALSQFMYHRGVERLQKKIRRRHRFLLFHDISYQWRYTVFRYDVLETKHGQPLGQLKLPEDIKVDLHAKRII